VTQGFSELTGKWGFKPKQIYGFGKQRASQSILTVEGERQRGGGAKKGKADTREGTTKTRGDGGKNREAQRAMRRKKGGSLQGGSKKP